MSESNSRSPSLTEDERLILQQSCEEAGIPSDIVERMITAEKQVYGMGRRHGVWDSLKLLVEEGVALEQEGTK